MNIKIVIAKGEDALPDHLTDLGIKNGDIIRDAQPFPNSRHDALQFWIISDDEPQLCTVMPKNYKKA
jgi:hypothetical protein